METENFDDAVRQKIESLNPKYEEKDIDKVHDYVIKNRSKTFNRRFALITAASLIMVIIAGLFAWNMKQMNDQKQMVQTIDNLKKNLANAQMKPAVIKSDTVFIKEYIHDEIVNTNSSAQQPLNTIVNTNVAKNDYVPLKSNSALVNKVTNESNNQKESNIINQNSNSKQIADNTINTANTANMSDNVNQNTVVKSNSSDNKSIDQNNKSNEIISKDTAFKRDSIAFNNNALAANNNAGNSSDTAKQISKERNSLFPFLKNWKYMAGIEGLSGNRQLGYGIKAEVLFNDRWGFNAGVRMLHVNNQNYNDDSDFYSKVGQDFQTTYKPYISDDSLISDIRIHINLIQIPIAFTYHFSLPLKFSGILGIGTDLDLVAKQDIDYRHHLTVNSDELKTIAIKYHALTFNNAVLSAGLEKKGKRIAFQLQSYASPQLQSAAYKKENIYFGLNMTVAYSFGI